MGEGFPQSGKSQRQRDKSHVQSLERAAELLTLMAAAGGSRVIDLARSTGLAVSTVHRLVRTMERLGIAESDEVTGRYRPGLRLFEWGQIPVLQRRVREVAKPFLLHLVAELGYSAAVVILEGTDVLYVDWVPAQHIVRAGVYIGYRVTAHCNAAGRAILAALPASERDRILDRSPYPRLTPHTPSNREEVLAILDRVREQGFGTDDEERQMGFRGVGVAVRGPGGAVVAGLTMGGPVSQLPRETFAILGSRLIECAVAVQAHLGYMCGVATAT